MRDNMGGSRFALLKSGNKLLDLIAAADAGATSAILEHARRIAANATYESVKGIAATPLVCRMKGRAPRLKRRPSSNQRAHLADSRFARSNIVGFPTLGRVDCRYFVLPRSSEENPAAFTIRAQRASCVLISGRSCGPVSPVTS
jgi:hypothetical protein